MFSLSVNWENCKVLNNTLKLKTHTHTHTTLSLLNLRKTENSFKMLIFSIFMIYSKNLKHSPHDIMKNYFYIMSNSLYCTCFRNLVSWAFVFGEWGLFSYFPRSFLTLLLSFSFSVLSGRARSFLQHSLDWVYIF